MRATVLMQCNLAVKVVDLSQRPLTVTQRGALHLILEADVAHSRTKGCCSDDKIQTCLSGESLVPFLSCIRTLCEKPNAGDLKSVLYPFWVFLRQSLKDFKLNHICPTYLAFSIHFLLRLRVNVETLDQILALNESQKRTQTHELHTQVKRVTLWV